MVDLDSLYSGNVQASRNGGLDLDSLYSGQTQNNTGTLDDLYDGSITPLNGKINLNTIEQIESAGNNYATSKTGAKGLYQFEPDTAYEYSKRLFGKGTRDASTLSAEQQKEMASAYFNDLLKEFNGNVNEAVAAYNWGQGNVEKDIKAHGSDWLDYAPDETKAYVAKYDRDNGIYEHQSKGGDAHWKPSWSEMEDTMSTQWEQVKDLAKGGYAEGLSLLGLAHDEGDIEEAKAELATGEGKAFRTTAAVGASVVAPELLPELSGFEGANVAGWLGKGLLSSTAYQGVANGDITLKQTAEDLALSGVGEGVLKLASRFGGKQVLSAFERLMKSNEATPEAKQAVRDYLAYARVGELGENWQALREVNPKATLMDAYKAMLSQAPELAKSKSALADMYAITKGFKNTGSALQLTKLGQDMARTLRGEAEQAAKDAASKRVLSTVAEAVKKTGANVPESAMASTPFQKLGQYIDDAAGLNTDTLAKIANRNKSIEAYRPEAEQLIKDLKKDTDRINRELRKINVSDGVTAGRRYTALRRQAIANTKMREALRAGLDGKKLKVNDLAAAVKDIQEEQFSGVSKSLTSRYQDLSAKFAASSVATLERSKEQVTGMITRYAVKKGAVATVAYFAQALGVPVPVLMAAASGAGMAARASRRATLKFASELVERVESGAITQEEAKAIIEARAAGKAKIAGRLGAALSENVLSN